MRKGLRCAAALVAWLVCVPTSPQARERVFYFHNDHLGTPQVMTDESGATVWQVEMEPFGEAVVDEDADGDGVPVVNNVRFPGQYFDAETGLHYNYHRDYDPATGRYLEADPIGILKGTNHLYTYVANNPIRQVDFLGLAVYFCSGKIKPEDCPDPSSGLCSNHEYTHSWVCEDETCAGLYPSDWSSILFGDGQVLPDPFVPSKCKEIEAGDCCDQGEFEACVNGRIMGSLFSRHPYSLFGYNCVSWAKELIIECHRESCRP